MLKTKKLRNSVVYLQCQSMRNNFIFCNIPETTNERNNETEEILRSFMVHKLELAQELCRPDQIRQRAQNGFTRTMPVPQNCC